MATDTRQIYVCDGCENEADENDVEGAERWIEFKLNGELKHICYGCWDWI